MPKIDDLSEVGACFLPFLHFQLRFSSLFAWVGGSRRCRSRVGSVSEEMITHRSSLGRRQNCKCRVVNLQKAAAWQLTYHVASRTVTFDRTSPARPGQVMQCDAGGSK